MNTHDGDNELKFAKNIESKILRGSIGGNKFEFAELLTVMKCKRLYKSLEFETFKEWYGYWRFSKPTVYSWMNVHSTFVKKYNFTQKELQQIEVRVLKSLLPLARSGVMAKDQLAEVMNNSKKIEFGKFLEQSPAIKRSFGLC